MKISTTLGADKAARIIHDAGGKVVGRTRLQKIAYLLEVTSLGEGFRFEYRHYGPYSEQLANAVTTAAMIGLVSEEEHLATWGGSYSVFSTKTDIEGSSEAPRTTLIRLAAEADSVVLELAATAVFLARDGEKSPWQETERRKPDKAAKLSEAKNLYSKLRELRTPEKLPVIGD